MRDRKKQQTRRAIAAAAAQLFRRRGYENVRMIDIARAAEVSEQTVYNYFPTKEHLVFDLDQEYEARMVRIVLHRPAGVSLAEALRTEAVAFLNELGRSIGKRTGVPVSVARGPALRRVWLEMNARCAASVAQALFENSHGQMRMATAMMLGRSIVAVFEVVLQSVGAAALEGQSRAAVVRELRPAIESFVLRMEHALR